MADLEFQLLDAQAGLYVSDQNSSSLALSLYYLLAEEQPSPPATLDFATIWRNGSGCYFFLPAAQTISDPAAFAAALRQLLEPKNATSQWLAWLPSSTVIDGALAGVLLVTVAKGVGEETGRVLFDATLPFCNLELLVQPETLVSRSEDAEAVAGLVLTDNSVVGGTLSFRQTGTTRVLDFPVDTALDVPFAETRIGSWVFDAAWNRGLFYTLFQDPSSTSTPPSAELRYTWTEGEATREARYPVLLGSLRDPRNPPSEMLPLKIRVDPLAPTDSSRTRFAFDLPAYGGDGPVLPTSVPWRTTEGHVVELVPVDDAGFALAERISSSTAAGSCAAYLTPAGRFSARSSSPRESGTLPLMCGIFGTELLLLAEEDQLDFSGASPAHATAFPDPPPAAGPLLDDAETSAWPRLIPGPQSGTVFPGAIKESYCVQAEGSVYYSTLGDIPFPIAIGALIADLADVSKQIIFPMVPYGEVFFEDPERGITNPNPNLDGATLESYEKQVIALERRRRIGENLCLGPLLFDLGSLEPLAGGYVQTPQGLLVRLNDGAIDSPRPAGTWAELILARSPQKPDQLLELLAGTEPSGCSGGTGPYEVVSPYVSTALMSNAPFLVVSRPEPLGTFQNQLQLGDYPFEVRVSGDDQGPDLGSNTVLVFKFSETRSFSELAADVGEWTSSEIFVSDDPSEVARRSAQILAFIEEARQLSEKAREQGTYDYFAEFLRRMDSPSWTGVIALNTPLLLEELPIDLQMLLGGMRSERPLRGHHLGITTSEIDSQASGVEALRRSSLFGLVFYDEAFQTPTAELDFQVLKLNALFNNSALKQFESQIAFSIAKLFDDQTWLVSGGENDRLDTNTIVIDGTLQERDGETSVVFQTEDVRVFAFKDPAQPGSGYRVLSNVVVRGAGLEPIDRRPAADPDAVLVRAAFSLGGGLGFDLRSLAGVPPLDLFSYPIDPATTDEPGMTFASYDFPMETEVQGDSGTLESLRRDLTALEVDAAEIQPRQDSLIGTLPLKLLGFRADERGLSSTSTGGRRVRGEGLSQTDPRWALELELVMGTLGALLSQPSPLEGTFLLGWNGAAGAAADDPVAMLFIPPDELADAGGFRVQGVFKTVYGDIVLKRLRLSKDNPPSEKLVYVVELADVRFEIVNLSLFPVEQSRSLTFFGDPNSSPGDTTGTSLSWFLGEPALGIVSQPEALASGADADADLATSDAADAADAKLIYSPLAGLMSGLRVDINPTQTIAIPPAISALLSLPISTQKALDDIYAEIPVSQGGIQYDPAAGVLAWCDISYLDVSFQAVLNDPALYGALVEVASSAPILAGLKLEIAYRRISDELGVFSANLTLPDDFREIEFGVAGQGVTLYLPSVGIAIYTNGDWRLDIGWPYGSTTSFIAADQIGLKIPIVVSGVPIDLKGTTGFYIAKLRSADNPAVFGNDFALIWMGGVGASFGIGKEFKVDGLATLSLEAYIWATLEAMLASKNGALTSTGVDYLWFAGSLGATANATGKVDLKVIKASLELEASVVLTVAFETAHSTAINLVVQFKINLQFKVTFFKITFRFTAEVPILPPLEFGSGPPALASGPTPTAVGTSLFRRLPERTPKFVDPQIVRPFVAGRAEAQTEVNLSFVLQPTAINQSGAGLPQAVATLLIELLPGSGDGDEFSKLVQGVANWLDQTYGGSGSLAEQLVRITEKLDDGTFEGQVETCLSTTFLFRILAGSTVMDDDTAAIFPIFPELDLVYDGATISLSEPAVPTGWVAEIEAYFDQLSPTAPTANTDMEALEVSALPTSVAGIVFADFFVMLGQQVIADMTSLAEADPSLTFAAALALVDYDNVAGAVSRYAQYGLRLPAPGEPVTSLSGLYQLTGQQIALAKDEEGAWKTTVELAYGTLDVGSWIVFGPEGDAESVSETLDPKLVLTAVVDPQWIPAGGGYKPLAPLKSFPQEVFFSDRRTWQEADGTIADLRQLPNSLQLELERQGELFVDVRSLPDEPAMAGRRTVEASSITAAPGLFITLSLEEIPQAASGEPLSDVYQLIGTDEATRDLLEKLLAAGTTGAELHMLASTGDSTYRSSVEDASILLVRSNLSTLTEPPAAFAALQPAGAVVEERPPNYASLADVGAFLELVWEASVVHAGGFFVYMKDLPEDAFTEGKAQIAVLVTFGAPTAKPRLLDYHNILVLGTAVGPQDAVAATIENAAGELQLVYRQNYPAGSVGFQISWLDPPTEPDLPAEPTAAQKEAFLEALYNSLQYQVTALAGSGVSLPSNWSLPIGANEDDAGNWLYRQIVPIADLLGADNRYAGVGEKASLLLRLLDMFGNALPEESPLDVDVVYNDPLIPINEWVGMLTIYNIAAGTGDEAQLAVTSRFQPTADLLPGSGSAAGQELALTEAIRVYSLVREQLRDPNAGLELVTTLAASPLTQNTAGTPLIELVVAYVDEILAYLEALRDGGDPAVPAPLVMTAALDRAHVAGLASDLFEVQVALRIFRAEAALDPTIVEQLPAVGTVRSPLAPKVDLAGTGTGEGAAQETGLRPFAEAFETAYAGFDGASGQLKLALGPPLASAKESAQSHELWAARWGADVGIDVTFPNTGQPTVDQLPVPLAPAPLSTQLISRTVDVRVYDDTWSATARDILTQEQARTFSNIDLDTWGRSFLRSLSDVLMADMATAVAELDAASYDVLIQGKEVLADTIRQSLIPVLVVPQQTIDTALPQERFRQALLQSLRNDYGTSAVVQMPASVSFGRTLEPALPPTLFGKVATPMTDPLTAPYTLTPAKLAVAEGKNSLSFLVATKNPAAQAVLDLDLIYPIDFVEHDFQVEDEKFGYIPSSWLTFLVPLFDPTGDDRPVLVVPMGGVEIPIPLRAFPPSPVLNGQLPQVAEEPVTISDALGWSYALAVSAPESAQDQLILQVTFNEPLEAGAVTPDVRTMAWGTFTGQDDPERPLPEDLFAALARYTAEMPAIEPELFKAPEAAFGSGDKDAARKAIERFTELVVGTVATWPSWHNPALAAEQARVKSARRERLGANLQLEQEEWELIFDFKDKPDIEATRRIVGSNVLPPWPRLAGFVTPPEDGKPVGTYTPEAAATTAGQLGNLAITFEDLYLLTHQSARSASYVVRNANLVPDGAPAGTTTDEAFVYRTPNVRLTDPAIPAVEVSDAITLAPTATLAEALDELFVPFVTPPPNVAGDNVVMELRFGFGSTYRYRLAKGGSDQEVMSSTPVFLAREDVATPENPTGEPPLTLAAFKQQLAAALAGWYQTLDPADQDAVLELSFTVFANLSETELPLARFHALQIPVPEGDPGWWGTAAS